MKIIEFAFIIYPVRELARSREFYEGVLGLKRGMTSSNGDQFYEEYEVGPHTIGISNEPFLKPSGDGPHLVVEVEDFEKAVGHIRAHKVNVAVEPFSMPNCRAIIVTDPDGNKVGIHKRNS